MADVGKKWAKLQTLEIVLPATSANLGPAFDAAALAFSMFLKVRARPANEFSVIARGRDSETCSQIENHLILTTYREVLQAEEKEVQPLALHIENQIPIGKGCGSSAAARLAGIALAVRVGRLRWTDSRIVYEAVRREHHPDNAAACWMGGLAIARISTDGDMEMVHVRPKGRWPLLLAVPEESLSTEDARRILPDQYSRADVVANIQNSMLLLAAFSPGAKGCSCVRLGRSHSRAVPSISVPSAAGFEEINWESRNTGQRLERGWTFGVGFPGSEIECEQSRNAGPPLPAHARAQPRTHSHGDHGARGKPADPLTTIQVFCYLSALGG